MRDVGQARGKCPTHNRLTSDGNPSRQDSCTSVHGSQAREVKAFSAMRYTIFFNVTSYLQRGSNI